MDNRPQQGQDLVDRGNDLEIVRGEEIEGNIAGMLFLVEINLQQQKL